MRSRLIRPDLGLLLALALVAGGSSSAAMELPALPDSIGDAMAQASPQEMADYRRRLKEYEEAQAPCTTYWTSISDKRRGRNAKRRGGQQITLDDYVLTHPPTCSGPKKPIDPSAPERPPRKALPMVPDLIEAAAEQFQFKPQRPSSEIDFKRAYAKVASSLGLTREQAVRVYSFETGGNGNYDMQSGYRGPGTRPISTAIGYNQLLTTNSVELMAEQGDAILKARQQKALTLSGPARKTLDDKIAVVKRMVAFAQSVPDTWAEHEKLADTPKGWALHAMVLDIDVGPHLQTHKLLTSVIFARQKGCNRPLSAAELEMMNLTGDGTGLDMVTMPQAMRERVPTANFFQRGGYERNPVASRNNTVAKLLAVTDQRMDFNSNKPGAIELAGAF